MQGRGRGGSGGGYLLFVSEGLGERKACMEETLETSSNCEITRQEDWDEVLKE